MPTDSDWGALDPAVADKLKAYVRQSVADGVHDAIAEGGIQQSIADGVAAGMRSVVEDEDLFDLVASRAAGAFRRSATRAGGELLIDGLSGLARRAALFVVLGVLVYSLGGWAGLVAAWKALTAHSSP